MRSVSLFALLSCAVAAPIISFISSPAIANQTVVLGGAGFTEQCVIVLTSLSDNSTTKLGPVEGQTADASLKFILPDDFPLDAYAVNVYNGGGAGSNTALLNVAQPWWCQGDAGDAASPGGWIRCFGLGMASVNASAATARQRLRYLRHELIENAALDDPAGDNSLLAAAAAEILALRQQLEAGTPAFAQIKLSPIGFAGTVVTLNAEPDNATAYSVQFMLPSGLPTGEYGIALSNGLGAGRTFVPLDSFVSPAQPHVSSMQVLPLAAWPSGVFPVTNTSLPSQKVTATSDAALAEAIAAAAAAGGGTIALSAGQFFLTQPVVLPPRTRLVGAGMDLTGIYFAEATPHNAPYAYFSLDPSAYATAEATADAAATAASRSTAGVTATSWAVTDLSVFITAFHNIVFDAANVTDGWSLARVRVRANAWLSQNGANMPTHNRWLNVSNWESLGPVVELNARNFVIEDCDLYGSYNVITSQRGSYGHDCDGWPNNCHGAFFGVVARNRIFNGGAGHFMNQWNHMIFEANVQRGTSLMAMGQAIGTADGGYASHIYLGDNDIAGVFGNDREVMTFDCSGGLYYGGVAGVSDTTIELSGDAWPAQRMEWGGFAGGSLVIVNGTGTGQWRRIVVPGVNAPASPSNRTWVVDKPFDVTPVPGDSIVQVLPFRGQNVWHRNTYADAGAVQFYGHAMANVVSESYFSRFGGLIAWGQWRGWAPPNDTNVVHSACGLYDGIQPNMQAAWIDNLVLEGLTVMNYNCSCTDGTRGSACGEQLYLGHSFVTQRPYFAANTSTPSPQHLLSVFRGNAGLSHSGMWLATSTSNAIAEGSSFASSTNCVSVDDSGTDLIWVRGSECSDDTASDAFMTARTIVRGPRL